MLAFTSRPGPGGGLANGPPGTFDLRIPQLNLGILLNGTVTGLVKGIVKDALTPILAPVLTALLQLLGIGLGQMVVTVSRI